MNNEFATTSLRQMNPFEEQAHYEWKRKRKRLRRRQNKSKDQSSTIGDSPTIANSDTNVIISDDFTTNQ